MRLPELQRGISRSSFVSVFFLLLVSSLSAFAQGDWIRTGTGLGVEKVRVAVADFKPLTADPQVTPLKTVFDSTLFSDLGNAGIFDLVSKSFNPLAMPGSPQELNLGAWANPPTSAAMVTFGNIQVANGSLAVQGWLFDAKNLQSPQVLGKEYRETATNDNARLIAHKFADEIILRLGAGVPGVAESRIVFVSNRTGHKEIWEMDYDGAGQRQLTHLDSIALSPRISPDGTRVAFSALDAQWNIKVYSLDLGRLLTFPRFGGTNLSPAWAPDGTKLAFSSSRTGDPEIFICDQDGANLKRVTAYHGPDVSPVWNPKTGAQIAWVSGRTGLPQIYVMQSDGTNPERLTDQGYAVSPSWSPNGQFLTFAWFRRYGPGAPGGRDIYVMDIASRQFIQLTHDAGDNDSPSWAPDNRHIVFERNGQIWNMLADGTNQKQLTTERSNEQPNWSWK